MNLEDESLLSGYLDDELDPADRLDVEWAVESSPPLADRLRGLASARDAVGGLGRPAVPRDVAFAIVADLAASRTRSLRPGRLAALARSGRLVAALAGISTMAASLFLALTLLHLSTHDDGDARKLLAIFKNSPPAVAPGRPHPIKPAGPIASPPPPQLIAKGLPATPPETSPRGPARPAPVVRPEVAAAGAREPEGRRAVAGMVGQPRVLRALIVTDVIDASERVRSLIELDPRKTPEFGRITIAQGIVVDPDRPDEAEVYPVVLDEGSCKPFLDRLRREFPGLRVEREVGAELLTQLPEVGQVSIFRGTGAAGLGDPPAESLRYIAHKAETGGPAEDADLLPLGKPRPRHSGDEPADELATADGGPIRDPRRGPGDPVTVIVWVTRPPRW